MPSWYLITMEQLFGSRANLLRFHIAVGMIWIVVCAVYIVFGWRHFLHAEVLAKEVALDQDDFEWLKMRSLSLLKKSDRTIAAAGRIQRRAEAVCIDGIHVPSHDHDLGA